MKFASSLLEYFLILLYSKKLRRSTISAIRR